MAELAFQTRQQQQLFELAKSIADQTNIAAYRFLTAWIAINSNDPKSCIDECEKVDEPYSALHTIHGQALLELGYVEDAIEVLNIAVKLSPSEILAWFQLAKAQHITNKMEECYQSLLQCRQLAPQSSEVVLFMAMVALTTPDNRERLMNSARLLSSFMNNGRSVSAFICSYIEIALLLEAEDDLQYIVQNADWNTIINSAEFVKKLPDYLRKLGELDWTKLNMKFLSVLTSSQVSA